MADRKFQRILITVDAADQATGQGIVEDVLAAGVAAEGGTIEELKMKEDSIGADLAYKIVKSG